jgi:hypothetical protein
MKSQSRRLAACGAALLGSVWAASAAAQSPWPEAAAQPRTEVARTCDEGDLRAHVDSLRVATAGGRVSLVLPEGMRALTPIEIGQRRQAGALLLVPKEGALVLGDDAGTTISLWQMDKFASRLDVEAFLNTIDWTLAALGGVQWISRRQGEGVSFNGTRWLRLDYTHRVRQIEHYVQQYLADFQGTTMVVRFSTTSTRGRTRNRFQSSAATLEVSDCALPREGAAPLPGR